MPRLCRLEAAGSVAALWLASASLPGQQPVADDAVLSVSSRPAEGTGEKKVYQADADWIPVEWKPSRIVPGSALDLSGSLHGPADREVVVRDDHFVFRDAPDRPLRFYGVVVTHGAPYMDKEHASQFVDYLAACGFNAVRLHLYTFVPGVKKPGADAIEPEALDKLDYFVACLKKKGFYLTLPINSDDFFQAGDASDVPEYAGKPFRFEAGALFPISGAMRGWIQRYAVNLLGHKNPYTGLALKDDPVLMSVELTNENPLFMKLRHSPDLGAPYRRACAAELRAASPSGAEPSAEQVEKELPSFVLRCQASFYASLRAFLLEAGVRKPFTDATVLSNVEYALPRSTFDYVDVHAYWALYRKLAGTGGEGADTVYRQSWANPNRVEYHLPPDSAAAEAAARIFGKPFVSGEFNAGYATPYWPFVGPAYAAFARLQGWTSVYRCGIAPFQQQLFEAAPVRTIQDGSDPLVMLTDRIGSLLTAAGEIEPRRERLPFVVTPAYVRSRAALKAGLAYPDEYCRLIRRYRLGTVVVGDGANPGLDGVSCVVVPDGMDLPPALAGKTVLRAGSGPGLAARAEAALPPSSPLPFAVDVEKGTGSIVAPGSETFLLPAEAGAMAGPCLSVSGNRAVSVTFAGSLDGKPLASSRRLLALYVTDLKNTGTEIEFEKNDQAILRRNGALPLLVRQGAVQLTLRSDARALPRVWALKYDGSRAAEVAAKAVPGGFSFPARAVTDARTYAAYEIAWTE